ncbi:hypothetical protein [Xanthobacter aminoxidans]|uniref:hypothetical protein n=1 Tax=Xanthobacter aminoxidans TaxID=186280 RepID=UPI00372B2DA9
MFTVMAPDANSDMPVFVPETEFVPAELTVIVPLAPPRRPIPVPPELVTLAPLLRLTVRLPPNKPIVPAVPMTPPLLVVSQFSVALPIGLIASLHAASAVPG